MLPATAADDLPLMTALAQFLAGWYPRIGYPLMQIYAIEESYSHLTPLLATPCDFVI